MRNRIESALLAVALAAGAGAASAQFCPGASPFVFTDVLASDPFCGSITFLAQQGVTLGCREIDANHRLYCPADSVRRDQMAAFMFRLSDALFPDTCAAGQVMKWNGLAWTCSDDSIGGGGGGGTVTSVAASTGLLGAPNPIVGAGTISIAPSYRLPQACAANQVPKWVGGAWTCGNDTDTNAGGTVTSLTQGSGIVLAPNPVVGAGTIAADTAYLQRRVTGTCAAGSSIRQIDLVGSVVCEVDDAGPANAFVQGGNAFGAWAELGTNDNQSLVLRANGVRGLRIQPTTADPANNFDTATPNIIGGWEVNAAFVGVIGATIGGGGGDFLGFAGYNRVTDHYGTVGGGAGNSAGNAIAPTDDAHFATVSGGLANTASNWIATIGGGQYNVASGSASTIAGGSSNNAAGSGSFIGGGQYNETSFQAWGTVGGGQRNHAMGMASTIGGGIGNSANGFWSAIPGGGENTADGMYSLAGGRASESRGSYSIALGLRAKAYNGNDIGNGAIVIADGNDFDFNIGTDNRFGVRATGGVYLALGIDGNGAATWVCQASNGNGWQCASDRNLKHSLVELDGRAVLEKVAALPVYQWQPKGPNAHVRHYGPMAQDFHAAFGLGDDDKMIGMQDADGVALAAIKGLNEKLEAKLAEQAREIAELRRIVERLDATR